MVESLESVRIREAVLEKINDSPMSYLRSRGEGDSVVSVMLRPCSMG